MSATPTLTLSGVYAAKVYSTADPLHTGRIQMLIPQIFQDTPMQIWAPPLSSGGQVPPVGSVVWCLFQGGDPSYPVYAPPQKLATALAAVEHVASGSINLPARTLWSPLPPPGPLSGVVHLDEATRILVSFATYLDTNVNNNEIRLALDASGANVSPAGSRPEHTLRAGAKQPIASTVGLTYVLDAQPGDTTVELRYTAASSGGTASDILVTLVALGTI